MKRAHSKVKTNARTGEEKTYNERTIQEIGLDTSSHLRVHDSRTMTLRRDSCIWKQGSLGPLQEGMYIVRTIHPQKDFGTESLDEEVAFNIPTSGSPMIRRWAACVVGGQLMADISLDISVESVSNASARNVDHAH